MFWNHQENIQVTDVQAKTFSPCKFHLKVQQSQNISHDTLARKK